VSRTRLHGHLRPALLTVALACSPPRTYSTGAGGPVPWTPGRYVLEATIGTTLSDQDFRAVLTIAPDATMSMDASTGLCRDPSPAYTGQDEARSRRTFECGDVMYFVQPTPTGVRGRLTASILEEYEAQTICPPQSGRTYCSIMRTRRVTRTADLVVSPLD
jgi:hypothetical protein